MFKRRSEVLVLLNFSFFSLFICCTFLLCFALFFYCFLLYGKTLIAVHRTLRMPRAIKHWILKGLRGILKMCQQLFNDICFYPFIFKHRINHSKSDWSSIRKLGKAYQNKTHFLESQG